MPLFVFPLLQQGPILIAQEVRAPCHRAQQHPKLFHEAVAVGRTAGLAACARYPDHAQDAATLLPEPCLIFSKLSCPEKFFVVNQLIWEAQGHYKIVAAIAK